ncbi:MAG: selenide, water dikinase SelD [Gammaproteobacteria bacterium]|nr:selenide, water dikinase SelD [Gammaproteobacteria bacterium]
MITSSWQRDLVLLGGGHSHALVLRMLAMQADPATRITLLSLDSHTPYSGMLPGLLAGHYSWSDAHIDLRKFCSRTGVRFIVARAIGIDIEKGEVNLEGRPALPFDVLSIDIGSQPGLEDVPGARDFATLVKPIHSFYQRWQMVEKRLATANDDGKLKILLVGGGAGSVELALAMRHRSGAQRLAIKLVCGAGLLESYNSRARKTVRQHCREQGIELLENARVVQVGEQVLSTADGSKHRFDELFWCTAAVAEGWLRDTGLPCDSAGFLRVTDTLQVQGYAHIFAAGDVATQLDHPRPKAGVYAVRQAPVLAHNLLACLRGDKLREHRPQRRFLSLLSLGDKLAVADRGVFSASGSWVWRWKDRIDRKFMALFDERLPAMRAAVTTGDESMHCGGCGAKLPSKMLRSGLQQLAENYPLVIDAQQLYEDAALLELSADQRLVQSIDVLRSLVDDPWLMGRIAVLHALSDLYAMGAKPHSALASLTIPFAGPQLQQRDLQQLMSGAVEELQRAGCRLLGGHTLEGPELAMGFTVNGELSGATLAKQGLQSGDQLVLCKPLGTGVLFAAQQQGQADGRWISTAIASMLQSSAAAASLALEQGVHAATDITGFGLLGHLAEMLQGSDLQARIELSRIPVLPGVEKCFAAGIASTLQPGNIASVESLLDVPGGVIKPRHQVLFDPQTCGGLLLSVAAAQASDLLQALRSAGYAEAEIVGEVTFLADPGTAPLTIVG